MDYLELAFPRDICLHNQTGNSVLHINTRSLNHKRDDVALFLEQFQLKFDLIMMTETWGTNDEPTFTLDGYNTFYLNRTHKRGGGVALLVTTKKSCHIVPEFSKITDEYEILTVQFKDELISVIYRPPNGSMASFMQFYENFLEYACCNNFLLISAGDFNINLLEENCVTRELNNLLLSSGFKNLINTPTRITCSTSSALDLVITNIDTVIYSAGTITSDISDHCPVFMNYFCKPLDKGTRRVLPTIQHITSRSLEAFSLDISKQNWSSVFKEKNADNAYDAFIQTFRRIYAIHFPFKTLKSARKARKPWVTREHLSMIKRKNICYHTFLRTRSAETLKEFKKLRNRLNAELQRAKKAYYQRIFVHANRQRSSATWKLINTILGRDNKNALPESITFGGKDFRGAALADHFNNYFINAVALCNDNADFVAGCSNVSQSIFLDPTNESEVCEIFKHLNSTKSLDADDLQITPIKHVLYLLSSVLTYIYNLVLEHGVFPEAMKKARVSVIFKGGDRNSESNYRPISVLPVFSKCLEKIIHVRITKFFNKHNVLTDAQFGFISGKSTETALLTLKEAILHNFEQNKFTLSIFLDFSKAFDSLHHNILLDKLETNGIRGVAKSLIRSYLSNRCQSVYINENSSSFLPLTRGVPQGSILGPLMFNVYINDIVQLDTTVKYVIYADDSTIILDGVNLDDIVSKANDILSRISSWSRMNQLKINPNKTKAIVFRAKNKVLATHQPLVLESVPIDIVDSYKILGVYFSSNLGWDTHVNFVCKKLSSVTGVMSRCRDILPLKVKLQIYYALFNSHLMYCSLVWATTSKANINKVITLQKKIVRQIGNIEPFGTTRGAFQEFNIIRADNLYTFRLLHTLYFSNKEFSNFIRLLSCLQRRVITIPTRNTDIWFVPRFRTTYRHQALAYNVPTTLNTHKSTISCNKKQLHSHFCSLAP